jgi:mitotic spindle assembly checkpoint protein MAD1
LGGSHGGIPAQSELKLAQMDGEINMLRKKLSEVQKASERLKQVFMRQITLLRESVPKIFGYQLEMVSDPDKRDCKAIFTLSPQTMGSNSKIIFKLLRDGQMELVENDFAKKYPKEIETFIKKFNSIPGFIANMTLENFQRQS